MKEEADFFNSLLESQIRWLGDSQNLVKLREKFDSNHDGKVSKEEFMAGANKLLFADLVRKYEKWQNDHEGFRGKELSKSTQSK